MAWFNRMIAVAGVALMLLCGVAAQDKPEVEGGESSGSADGEGEAGSEAGETDKDAGDAVAAKIRNKRYETPEMRAAIKKALKRLSELQDTNGSFSKGTSANTMIAVTSLSGLALLASGSNAETGPYSANINKAVEYLLSIQDPNTGYFTTGTDGSRIHGHGYATLFLAQVYGSQQSNKKLKKSLKHAVSCIEKGQTKDGGWGYVPDDLTWDEGSTTVCCMQALRAASDAGIHVQGKTIQLAIDYMYSTAVATPFEHDGIEYKGYTFKYSRDSSWSSESYAICAAAISTLNGIGIYAEGATWEEKEIGKVYRGGLDWLRYKFEEFIKRRQEGQSSLDTHHFYYAHFYACQAMWNAPEDDSFDAYFPRMRDLLLDEHKRSATTGGGWPAQSYGEAYTTAFALLILQVPYQMLPFFSK